VKLRPVNLGPLDDQGLTITGGLAPGEQVVISGPDRLRDGRQVKVRTTVAAGPPARLG
jgi:multidrug efflux pump subunit AcrA (membrane-fusion protein)